MSEHRKRGRLSRRLRRSPHLITAAVLVFGAVPTYFAVSASASSGTLFGGFEIDGTIVAGDLTPTAGDDWGSVGGQPVATDPIGGLDTSVFSGSKEDAPLGWRLKTTAPGKDDIGRVYEFSQIDPSTGHQFAYFAFERASSSGTVNFVIELNQNPNIMNSHGVSIPDRAAGDLRFNVTQTGNNPNLTAHGVDQFDGTNYTPLVPAPPAAAFASAVNTASIPALAGDPLGANIPADQFAEFAFDMTALTPSGKPCDIPPFSELNSRSRASDSNSAEVKDFIAPVSVVLPGSCFDLKIHKFAEDGTTPLKGATFTVDPDPADGTSVAITAVDGGANDSDHTKNGLIEFKNAAPLGVGNGYTVTETAAPDGYLLASPDNQTSADALAFHTDTLSFTDDLGSVTFTKVDAATGTAQCCATFRLTKTSAPGINGTIDVTDNGSNDDDSPANVGGTITVTGLTTGDWKIDEITPPGGFSVDSTEPTFTISDAHPDIDLTTAGATFSDQTAPLLDVGIVKTDSPDPVDAGGTLTYTLQVTNEGTSVAGAITVSDPVPAVLDSAAVSVPPGSAWTCAISLGGTLTCDLPAGLAVGADADPITLTGTVNDSALTPLTTSGQISNTATITTGGGSVASNDTSTATTTVRAPDLRMTKVDNPDPATVDSELDYTLTVDNLGTGPTTGTVTVTDSIDPNLTINSIDGGANWTCGHLGQDVTCTWTGGAIQPTASADDIVISVTPTVAAIGVVDNTATVTTAHDPISTNNSSTIRTTVNPTPADPAAAFTDSCGPPTSITVALTNDGGTDEDVTVTKPNGTTENVPVPAHTAVATPATTKNYVVSPGQPSVSVDSTHLVQQTHTFALNCAGPPPPPSPANLTLVKSSLPTSGSTVQVGDSVTYTLDFANAGGSDATGSLVSDPLPADTTFLSATAGGSYDAGTNTVSWALGTINPGTSGTVSFVVQVANTATDGEVITNVGAISAAGVAPVSSNPVTLTVSVPVTPPTPTLDIAKKVNKTDAEFGDTLSYSFTVLAGGVGQTGVQVTDTIPDGTEYVPSSATCSTGCSASLSGGVLTWDVGNLAQGQSVDLTFKVTITRPQADANGGIPAETITNSGFVNSHELVDPVESNEVKTNITAVLGVHVTRPVHQPQHSPLPFTGLPVGLVQLLTMAAAAVGFGSLLVQAARSRRRVTGAIEPPADE
jgi:uncharacterized repeat protein (TIGR01451 family)